MIKFLTLGCVWLILCMWLIIWNYHECHAVTTRTMNTTWWPWDSHGEIKRFPLGECPIWPAPHHKRFLVVSPWHSLCYHEESRGLTMRFFWSPREIFWWIKIFTCSTQKASSWSRREILFVTTRNLAVSPWDSFGHHEESFGEWKFFTYPPTKTFLVVSPWDSLCHHEESCGLTVKFFWSPRGIFWWMKIFTYPPTKSFLVVSPWDSFGHHKQSLGK